MSPAPLPAKRPGRADTSSGGEPVAVLAVASGPSRDALRRIVGHSRWTLLEAATVAEADVHVRNRAALVLICDAVLPDGSWRDVLDRCLRLPQPPPVIVAADHADDFLWMEVLNAGGYNLLGKPFTEQEVFQIVSTAWLNRRDRLLPGLRAQAG
jgi:DNA-binding NtrC family response regulator